MSNKPFPDTVYIPDRFNWSTTDYQTMFDELVSLQGGKCVICEEPLRGIIDRHECIVTKGDVQSWPDSWKFLIINLYNCSLVHRNCHRHGSREFYWVYKCQMFGKEEMERWYYSLPFKNFPRRFE